MHTTLAYAVSLNGKITRGDNPDVHAWTSDEDAKHFIQLKKSNQVIIMDRKTYEAAQPQPEAGTLRIVFTSTPELFSDQSVDEKLEFVSVEPGELLKQLELRGYDRVLLAGGSRLSSSFLSAGLVDELYLTYELWLFGSGRAMLDDMPVDLQLELLSIKQLNKRGSLLARYKVCAIL